MSKKPIYLFILCVSFAIIQACGPEEFPINNEIPETRSFFLGFTAFPFDLGPEAEQISHQNALQNGDIYLSHLDHGVPWEEALNGDPFPDEIQGTLNLAKQVGGKHKVYLSATPTSSDRISLANYWNNDGRNQPLPEAWLGRSFDDSLVITAYINYCTRIIGEVNPDYFAYAIETNASFQENDEAFKQFKVLADTVYKSLQAIFPDLPIFLTLQDQAFNKDGGELLDISRSLLEHSDFIAMSTYPYWDYDDPDRDADPELFPNDWLSEFKALDPNKPFAITETGFIAEDLNISELDVQIKGKEKWQADYVQKLFRSATFMEAEFVMWFVYRDYDLFYENTPDAPFFFKIWKDIGIEDGNGNARPAKDTWITWRDLPKN